MEQKSGKVINAEKLAKCTDVMVRTIRLICDSSDSCEECPFECVCAGTFYIFGETDEALKKWIESEVRKMNRYIDIDFLAKFPHWERIVKELKCAPTADVAEVKHGKWRKDGKINPIYFCSVCRDFADKRSSFCPNCGARMDGDEHDN